MSCVAFGIHALQRATAERERLPVFGNNHAFLGYGHDVTVHLEVGVPPVNRHRALDQLRRIDHVRRTAGVQDSFRVRQSLHQRPGAAGFRSRSNNSSRR